MRSEGADRRRAGVRSTRLWARVICEWHLYLPAHSPNGRSHMTLRVADTRELVGWLLSFGRGVKVVRPAELQERVRREAVSARASVRRGDDGQAQAAETSPERETRHAIDRCDDDERDGVVKGEAVILIVLAEDAGPGRGLRVQHLTRLMWNQPVDEGQRSGDNDKEQGDRFAGRCPTSSTARHAPSLR